MSSSQQTVAARKKGHGGHLSNFAQTHPVSGILLTTLREAGCSPLGISDIKVCKWVPKQLIPYNYLLHNTTFYCITLYILYNDDNYLIVTTVLQYGMMVKSWNQTVGFEPNSCKLQSTGSQRVGHDWATSLPMILLLALLTPHDHLLSVTVLNAVHVFYSLNSQLFYHVYTINSLLILLNLVV